MPLLVELSNDLLQSTLDDFSKPNSSLSNSCIRHAGYIKLELPVFHIGYMKPTLQILQAICKNCSHVLLDADERRKYLK